MILAGKVLVEEQKIDKAGALVGEGAAGVCWARICATWACGVELERALEHWKLRQWEELP